MQFDSNTAWKDATALVSASREGIVALAGVFVVLPAMALAILAPPPAAPESGDPNAMLAQMSAYYQDHWPALLGAGVLQLIGTLAMLALFTDRTRPTVGEALQIAVKGLLPVIGAQLLAGGAMALAAIIPLSLAMLAGSKALMAVAIAAIALGLIYFFVRISLVAPVVMVDLQRNPVTALKRSWDLTRGNTGRLLLFYMLLFIGFGVVVLLAGGLSDLVLRLALGDTLGTTLAAFVSAALQAVMTTYFMAVYAAVHRQLSGPTATVTAGTFD